jgi:hypothetical protein
MWAIRSFFLLARTFVEAHYLAHAGVVQTEVIADVLQRIPAAGVRLGDGAVPIVALPRSIAPDPTWVRNVR